MYREMASQASEQWGNPRTAGRRVPIAVGGHQGIEAHAPEGVISSVRSKMYSSPTW